MTVRDEFDALMKQIEAQPQDAPDRLSQASLLLIDWTFQAVSNNLGRWQAQALILRYLANDIAPL